MYLNRNKIFERYVFISYIIIKRGYVLCGLHYINDDKRSVFFFFGSFYFWRWFTYHIHENYLNVYAISVFGLFKLHCSDCRLFLIHSFSRYIFFLYPVQVIYIYVYTYT